ncbi:hypothetical protein ACD877_26650, partial [Escherichia coli]
HRRLACEPGGCSAPVAGYSACLTSFTSSIRFSLHAYDYAASVAPDNLLNSTGLHGPCER